MQRSGALNLFFIFVFVKNVDLVTPPYYLYENQVPEKHAILKKQKNRIMNYLGLENTKRNAKYLRQSQKRQVAIFLRDTKARYFC